MQRNAAIVISGQFVSVIGDGIAAIAVLWWVLQSTGSAAAMGAVAAVAAAATVALSPFAGVLVDRLDRRRLMIGVDLARAAIYGGMALLAATGHLPLWAVFLLLTAARAAGSLFFPSLAAALPQMVVEDGLERANGLLGMAQNGGQILGAAIGGVLVAALGVGAALGADAVSFVVSVASLAVVTIPPVRQAAGAAADGFFRQMRAGLRFLGQDGLVRSMTEFGLLVNGAAGAITVLFPLLAAGPLHAGAQGYGALEAGFPAGMLAGLAIISARPAIARSGIALYGATAGAGLAVVGLALSPSLGLAVAFSVIGGVLVAVPNVMFTTLLQRRVPAEMQGRVFGLVGGLGQGLSPVAQAVAGVLSQAFGSAAVTLASGLAVAGSAAGFGLAAAPAVTGALSVAPRAAPAAEVGQVAP